MKDVRLVFSLFLLVSSPHAAVTLTSRLHIWPRPSLSFYSKLIEFLKFV